MRRRGVRIAREIRALRRSGADVGAIGPEVDREGCAGLERHNAVESPAATKRRLPAIPASAEVGERVSEIADKAMAMIEAGSRPLRRHIPYGLRKIRFKAGGAGVGG